MNAPGAENRKTQIHFLHIGKNAGTQFQMVAKKINQLSEKFEILTHRHNVLLRDIPSAASYLFSIRLPDSRFRSAFYSRKRKGQPRHNFEWNRYEEKAFSEFEHANDLAEALFEDGERGFRALMAVKSIDHCSKEQINWFDECGYFFDLMPPVDILRQEYFENDLSRFLRKIEFELEGGLDDDPINAHKNDYTSTPPLSDKANANLLEWYRQDFEFYKRCEEWISSQRDNAKDR